MLDKNNDTEYNINMLKVLKRLKEQTDAKWEFHEIMLDRFPGGFHRELYWAAKYEERNLDSKRKYYYKIEVST